ncbi:MAG: DUF429 domain-containing protein [Anaerolineaceae bacterium]
MVDLLSTTFIGIDLKAGKRSYSYAALDGNCKLIAYGQGRFDDVFSFISGCHSALCAINAPISVGPEGERGPDFYQNSLFPIGPQKGRKRTNAHRQAEHDLLLKGISVQNVPTQQDLPHAPVWIRRGFQFVELLEQTGFKLWPAEGSERQFLEVQADAAFWHWLGNQPLNEESLEGRIQRQLILSELDLDVPDPMNFFEEVTRFKLLKGQLIMAGIYEPRELNAMMCAVTALLLVKSPDQVIPYGNRGEGFVYLPSHKNNSR